MVTSRLTHLDRRWALHAIKLLHTAAWGFFAGAVMSIPVFALRDEFMWVGAATAVVLVEVVILALNGWRCPLTNIAERFTQERRANFDIYLPQCLATYNKQIFGALFIAGILFALARAITR
jgi:hypothetical protein